LTSISRIGLVSPGLRAGGEIGPERTKKTQATAMTTSTSDGTPITARQLFPVSEATWPANTVASAPPATEPPERIAVTRPVGAGSNQVGTSFIIDGQPPAPTNRLALYTMVSTATPGASAPSAPNAATPNKTARNPARPPI